MYATTTVIMPENVMSSRKLQQFIDVGTQGHITQKEFLLIGLNATLLCVADEDEHDWLNFIYEEVLKHTTLSERSKTFCAIVDDLNSFVSLVIHDFEDLMICAYSQSDLGSGELWIKDVYLNRNTIAFNVIDYGDVVW